MFLNAENKSKVKNKTAKIIKKVFDQQIYQLIFSKTCDKNTTYKRVCGVHQLQKYITHHLVTNIPMLHCHMPFKIPSGKIFSVAELTRKHFLASGVGFEMPI